MQVLGKIFFSMHRAEMGLAGETEDELFLPQNLKIPTPGAPQSVRQQCVQDAIKRGPLSLVARLFGLDVQVLNLWALLHLGEGNANICKLRRLLLEYCCYA